MEIVVVSVGLMCHSLESCNKAVGHHCYVERDHCFMMIV